MMAEYCSKFQRAGFTQQQAYEWSIEMYHQYRVEEQQARMVNAFAAIAGLIAGKEHG